MPSRNMVSGSQQVAYLYRKGYENQMSDIVSKEQQIYQQQITLLRLSSSDGMTVPDEVSDYNSRIEEVVNKMTQASLGKDRIAGLVSDMINGVSLRDLITSFAGLRPVLETEDFYIEPSKRIPAFIQVAGIQSPGLTASPAIGEYVVELLKKEGLELKAKTAERVKNYKIDPADPAWNRIVCRCEKISEAEIVEAIRKGHTTVDGIKFHTRSGMGRCQGGFCAVEILKIISRETGMSVEELTKRGGGSRIIAGKLGSLEVKA